MSTSPDDLVNLLSQWLARHVGDEELRTELNAVDSADLSPGQRTAVQELREQLERGDESGDLEMVVRETLESLAVG
jgi:hypothetical protein